MLRSRSPLLAFTLLILIGTACGGPRENAREDASGGGPATDQSEGSGRDVLDLQLLTPSVGWVLTHDRLNRTVDAGNTWQDITPPTTSARELLDVFFLDSTHGWAAAANDQGGLRIWITKDGGNSWVPSLLSIDSDVSGLGTPVYVDFIDDLHGWVMTTVASSSNFSMGRLFRTADGGTTWNEVKIPIGGKINFVTPTDGWAAGGASGDDLYVTRDGGTSWTRVEVNNPPAFPGATPAFDVPTFFTPMEGVLPVTFTGKGPNSGFAFYMTSDGGESWRLPGPVIPSPNPIASGVTMLSDPVNPATWLEADPLGRRVTVEVGRGQSLVQRDANGLGSGVFAFDFASDSEGWAASATTDCPNKTDCTHSSSLLTTENQGQDWTRLLPP